MEMPAMRGGVTAVADESLASAPPSAQPKPAGALARLYYANQAASRAIISLVVGAILWEAAGWYAVAAGKKMFFVPLTTVFGAFFTVLNTGELQRHAYVSFQEFAIGFVLAALVGVSVGLLMGTSQAVHDYLDPWVSFLYATPTIALAPIFILWLGMDVPSKAGITFLLAVLPIVINTAVGIRSTDRTFIETARSFCASRWQIFRSVLIPSALPFIVAGLRLGVGRGIIGMVVAEFAGAKAGVGFMINYASQVFDTATLFAGILLLGGTGIFTVVVLQRVERRLAPWREFTTNA